jgi:hypothetical protein
MSDSSRSFTKARRVGAKRVDECSVANAKCQLRRMVACVNEGRGAAVGSGRLGVRILGEDGLDTHRLAAFLFVVGLRLCLNLADDTPAFGLALILGQMLQTRQRREPHVEGSTELRREHGFTSLAGRGTQRCGRTTCHAKARPW